MTSIAFNTMQASRKLRDAGVEERVAEAIVDVVSQTADLPNTDHLAVKSDLGLLRSDLEAGMAQLESRIGERLRTQTLALLGGVAAIVSLATAIIKLVP